MLNAEEFQTFLDGVTAGLSDVGSLRRMGKELNRGDDYFVAFTSWLMNDPEKRSQYFNAMTYGAESLANYAIEVAQDPTMDFPQKKIIGDLIMRINKSRAKDRWGDIQKVEQVYTVNLVDAMKNAEKRIKKEIAGCITNTPPPLLDRVEKSAVPDGKS